MVSMERRPNNKDKITKTGKFSRGITEELESSKYINRKGKESYKEAL